MTDWKKLGQEWLSGECPRAEDGCGKTHLCQHCLENAQVDFDCHPALSRKVEPRTPLAVGDVVEANPCQVQVTEVTEREGVWGWCRTCKAAHALDGPLWERGLGPWKLVERAPVPA